jgi:hypothetical protein
MGWVSLGEPHISEVRFLKLETRFSGPQPRVRPHREFELGADA